MGNVERVHTSGEPKFELADESADVVLLYDVFHSHCFPGANDRRRLLDEVYRIARADATISVWAKHMESEARAEIESANFYLRSEYSGTLIHDDKDTERGQVLSFGKRRE